jgi:hypothetical protein
MPLRPEITLAPIIQSCYQAGDPGQPRPGGRLAKPSQNLAVRFWRRSADNYPVIEPLKDFKSTVTLKVIRTFSQPGTYFPVLRPTSQRDGDAKAPHARIQNLGRVRVVVN